MRIAVIGATGNIGSRIVSELVSRGHDVTGVVRNPEGKTTEPGVRLVRGNADDPSWAVPAFKGFDAVISAGHFHTVDAARLVSTLKAAGVPRLLVVGGAGGLLLADGIRLIDSPDFPEVWKAPASKGIAFVDTLREETELDWTFFAPPAEIGSGERTGKFRLDGPNLVTGQDGSSRISYEDYAVAMVNELERPAYTRQQFTIGY